MALPATPAAPAIRPAAPSAATTRLHGRWLLLARAGWLAVAALSLGLFAAAVPVQFAHLQVVCPTASCPVGDFAQQLPPAGVQALAELGLSLRLYAAYFVALDVVVGVGYSAVAAVIFGRKSDDRLALFTALALLTFGTATFTHPMMALMLAHPAWGLPVAGLNFLGAAAFGLFLFLFPDGRFVPRWTRWVALVWLAWQAPKYWSPTWNVADVTTWPEWLSSVVWLGALGAVISAQVYRYRQVSTAVQRRQTKWVVLGIATALTLFLGGSAALDALAPESTSAGALLTRLVGATLIYLAVLLIPLAIGIAMLHAHLFDVDLLINRTLVYGALTASIVAIYVLVVGYLGALFRTDDHLLPSLVAACRRPMSATCWRSAAWISRPARS